MLGEYEEWEDDALCKQIGSEFFFPEEYQGTNTYALAKRVCDMCPVTEQCLARALRDEEPHGMWGGVTPHTRLRMLQERHGEDYRWPMFDDGVGQLPPEVLRHYCKNNLHPMVGRNVVYDSRGSRTCDACRKTANRRRNRRRRTPPLSAEIVPQAQ